MCVCVYMCVCSVNARECVCVCVCVCMVRPGSEAGIYPSTPAQLRTEHQKSKIKPPYWHLLYQSGDQEARVRARLACTSTVILILPHNWV